MHLTEPYASALLVAAFGLLLVLAGALIYPVFADSYDVGNFSYFLIWIFMALGLCLMWGYGGMLSFGQTLFFGIAGYVLLLACAGGAVSSDNWFSLSATVRFPDGTTRCRGVSDN